MDDAHRQLLAAVGNYEIPSAAIDILQANPPLIIAAVTAAGKNTVADRIMEQADYKEVVSHTTRPPREGEINGQHYWFVDDVEMLRLVREGEFIEVQTIHGETVYGTSIKAYQTAVDDGKPLLVMDVQGVHQLMQKVPELKPIFILPPDYEEWMQRLHRRGVISHVEKEKRMDSARKELELALRERFHFVVNRDVDEAAHEILSGDSNIARQSENRKVAEELLQAIIAN